MWPNLIAAAYGISQNGRIAILKVVTSSSQNILSEMCSVFRKINNAITSVKKSIFMSNSELVAFSCIKNPFEYNSPWCEIEIMSIFLQPLLGYINLILRAAKISIFRRISP